MFTFSFNAGDSYLMPLNNMLLACASMYAFYQFKISSGSSRDDIFISFTFLSSSFAQFLDDYFLSSISCFSAFNGYIEISIS